MRLLFILLTISTLSNAQLIVRNRTLKFPDSVQGLQGWYACDNPLNTVTSGTMVSLKDKSSFARHMTLTTSTLPLYTSSGGLNNKPYITIDPTHSIRVTGLTIGPNVPIYFYIVFKQNDLTNNVVSAQNNVRAILDFQGDRDTGLFNVDADASVSGRVCQMQSGATVYSTNKNLNRLKWNVVGGALAGSSSQVILNRDQKSRNGVSVIAPNATVTQFGLGVFSLTANYDFAELIVYAGSISSVDDKLIRDYLNAKYQPTDNATIEFYGNSTTAGSGSTAMYKNWTDLLCIAKNYDVVNYGVAGSTVTTSGIAGSNLLDIYTQSFNSAYWGQYLFFDYGINDANAGIVDASWKTQYKAIIQSFITFGYPSNKIVICKPPAKAAAQAGRALVNQYITEISSELGIGLADVYTAFINNGGDALYVDSLHPNDAGYAVWATVVDGFVTTAP